LKSIEHDGPPANGEAAPKAIAIEEYRRALLNPSFDDLPSRLEERRIPLSFANPYGSRLSEYEQVLLYNQPNPDWIPGGLGAGGWGTRFPGGRGAWENYSTEAKTSDWFAFRDPEGRWQRPYVAEKADGWREFQRLVATSARRRSERALDPEWAGTMASLHLGALALHDYGIFMALAAPIRDCLADTLRAAIVNSALDFLDNAQMVQAEKLYLAQVSGAASAEVAPAQHLWRESPQWRGARALVEEIWGETYDHIEILFAIHVIHEPIFGRLLREGLFSRYAPLHGDGFTPRVLGSAIRGAEAAAGWAVELFGRTLAADPVFGEYNRRLFSFWAEKWLPLESTAVAAIKPLWSATRALRETGAPAEFARFESGILADWRERFGTVFAPNFEIDHFLKSSGAVLAGGAA
jgi:hypothetical protein